jgi:hypothetical protein
MALAIWVYDGIRVCVCRVRDSHPSLRVIMCHFAIPTLINMCLSYRKLVDISLQSWFSQLLILLLSKILTTLFFQYCLCKVYYLNWSNVQLMFLTSFASSSDVVIHSVKLKNITLGIRLTKKYHCILFGISLQKLVAATDKFKSENFFLPES